MNSEVRLDRDGSLATLTFCNPGKRNAMTDDMYAAIPLLCDQLRADPEVLALIITGEGGDFCAGSDISGLPNPSHTALPALAERALREFPAPVIAAISGNCLGGGLQLANACDLRFAAEDALFAVPPAKLGIVFGQPATERLVELVGPARAKYLLFSASRIGAHRAYDYGLVDEIVVDPVAAAHQFAAVTTKNSQLSVCASKAIVEAIAHGDDVTTSVLHWREQAHRAPDFDEGVSAFLAKRQPEFQWRRSTS